MLVLDFKVNSRLKILKGIFSLIHRMPLMRMRRKKGYFVYNRGSCALLATTTKLFDIKYKFYISNGDLTEINNKEY